MSNVELVGLEWCGSLKIANFYGESFAFCFTWGCLYGLLGTVVRKLSLIRTNFSACDTNSILCHTGVFLDGRFVLEWDETLFCFMRNEALMNSFKFLLLTRGRWIFIGILLLLHTTFSIATQNCSLSWRTRSQLSHTGLSFLHNST